MADAPSSPSEHTGAQALLTRYLLERDPVFRELHALREAGHDNPTADAHFAEQRKRADFADEQGKRRFYKMMQDVGAELNSATRALDIQTRGAGHQVPPMILDLCMAPGGFSSAALKANPTAKLRAITLPPSQGGHDVFLPVDNDRVTVQYLDITLLAAVMGVPAGSIPPSHPDAAHFRHDIPFASDGAVFGLVFCDGQVLRTHSDHRAGYRARNEATRLLASQLVLALQRIRQDGTGTLVVLLHRVDRWATARLVRAVGTFADVRLFKPRTAWVRRGSFYLVARNVRPRCAEAERAVAGWKEAWRRATFGPGPEDDGGEGGDGLEDGRGEGLGEEEEVRRFMDEFGPALIKMGRPVWRTQLEGLRKAPWNKK